MRHLFNNIMYYLVTLKLVCIDIKMLLKISLLFSAQMLESLVETEADCRPPPEYKYSPAEDDVIEYLNSVCNKYMLTS